MRLSPSLALAFVAPLASADVTVGPIGSGAAFNDIQAAIDAVGPGETVFVQAGQYDGPLVIPGGVRVVGAGSGQTVLRGGLGTGADARHVTIANVGAGQQAGLVGVEFAPVSLGGTGTVVPSGLVVEDCAGSVTVADVVYAPAPTLAPNPFDVPALSTVIDSEQVLLQAVVMDASGLVEPGGAPATIGLDARGSRVYALDCAFAGGPQLDGDGGEGILLDQATLWFTGSTARGADGAILQTDAPVGAPLGGVGVRLRNMGRLELFGGFGNNVTGGKGGGVLDSTGTVPVVAGEGAPALSHVNGSSSVLAAGSSLTGGLSVDNSMQAPPSVDDGTGGLLFFLEGNFGLRSDTTLVSQLGQTVTLEIRGNSNALAGTFFALGTVPQYTFLPFFGDIHIDPFLPSIVPVQNLGFGGQASLALPFPALPAGLTIYAQTLDLGQSFAPSVSQPLFLQVAP